MNKRRFIEFLSLFIAVLVSVWGFVPLNSENISNNPEKAAFALNVEYNLPMPENAANSAIVIEAESGSVLYSKNADMPRGMASTTKIMTAMIAIENCNIQQEFNIPKEAVGIEGSSVYLVEGEPLTMEELLYCLLLESGNDAATAIAICCAGSEEAFTRLMNLRVEELGLKNTHFSNPHGLSHESHKTTARELAIITAEAMKYPLFREIVSTKTASVRYNGAKNGRRLVNHNKLLFGFEGAIGVKTGYTTTDGKCLVSAAERNGLRIIAVTLSDSNATNTHKLLLENTFENFERVTIAEAGLLQTYVPISNREGEFALSCNPRDISVCLPKGSEYEFEIINEDIEAPIEEGQITAKVICRQDGKEVYIIYLESVKEIK